jgi:rfaE bifunctional protein nucleotidyltransferase chain/domain
MTKAVTLKKIIDLCKKFSPEKKVILATGVFDILHTEHLRFLKKAKSHGDILIVGIESDKRVSQLKGKDRPINPEPKRVKSIAAIDVVDFIFILPNNLGSKKGREQLVKSIKPDIYAISANTPFIKEKERIMKKFAGRLKVVHPHNPRVSSSKIITSRQESQKQRKRAFNKHNRQKS